MYNLLISGNPDEWEGEPCTLEIGRCVNEYTDKEIIKQFGLLDAVACQELMRMPCIFAYESGRNKAPKFGTITNITKRQQVVRIEYDIQPVDPFLTAEQMESLKFELDMSGWETNRTHWAVKDVNLPKELHAIGIKLPSWSRAITKAVDISTHSFDVALSFPGQARDLVEAVASELEGLIGPNSYFYDSNYTSQLARPSLDLLLQDIYRNRSKLIVVFLSGDYQNRDWCGIEFRAISDIIAEREHQRIMFIRTDDGAVEGIFKTDGYVDARKFSAKQLAEFIYERATV